jgi:carbamoyltransferase
MMMNIGGKIKDQFKLKRKPKIEFVEHHLAHASSAFFVSPFDEAAILTWDGRGESTSTMLSYGIKNEIKKIKEVKVPHSLGHLYSAITDYLGFKSFYDEWKVMGLSAYGKETYVDDFQDLIVYSEAGEYRLNLRYFKFHTHGTSLWMSDYFLEKFGSKREYSDDYTQHTYDIALALQRLIENTGVRIANDLYNITKSKNLCVAGGVALNVLMNKAIVKETPFDNYFFQPISNDAGPSFGSSLYYYHQILNHNRNFIFNSVYLGTEYSNVAIEKVLIAYNLNYKKINNIAKVTAEHIAAGKIVGWFQGKMEAGPRALGNRSIVVDPRSKDMKDRLNKRVKRREFFRPFAPSVLEERVSKYFVMPKNQLSPYMMLVGDVVEDMCDVIPAITHADGTARVHTVNKKVNPKYWELISEFEKITGVAVIINTSFNENEPIVHTPKQAVECFLRTEFDVLSIGDYIVEK